MGERVLCKHEVVGSIPSGSTTSDRKEVISQSIPLISFDWPAARLVRRIDIVKEAV